MPRKPKSPCSYPGCPKLTDYRYCEKHKRLTNKNYNKYQRDPKSNKRYGRAWKRIRRLSQQPWKLKWRFPAQIWHNGFGKQPKPYREVTANVSIPQEGRSVDRKECLPVTNGAIDSIRFTGSCERTI